MSGTITAPPPITVPAPTVSPATVYEFDEITLTELCSVLMWDGDFLRRTDGLVLPDYFPNEIERAYVAIALDHWKKYQEAPSKTVWGELLKDAFKAGRFRGDQKTDAVAKLGETSRLEVRSRAWLLDKIAEFAQHQAIVNAMISSVKSLNRATDPKRFETIRATMLTALDTGLGMEDDDYDYFERIQERTDARLHVLAGGSPKTGITTGVPELDNCMILHKGWGRKELSLLIGGAKSSKSFSLYFFAAKAVEASKNVLLITLENSREITAGRVDAYWSAVPISQHMTSPHTVDIGVKHAAKRPGMGVLKIRECPAFSFRPSDLRRVVDQYKTKGLIFDLVVIDYMDLMAPDHRSDSGTENSKQVYTMTRAVAQAEGFGILSATQTNRAGHSSATIKAEHVAEDFNRIRIADIVIGINRTEDEKAEGKARLSFVAARNQPDGQVLFIKQDLDKGLAVASVESVE